MRAALVLPLLLACGEDERPVREADAGAVDAGASVDAGSSRWTTGPDLLGGAVQETAVVALDGQIVVLGGFDVSQEIVAAVRIYDLASGAWSNGVPLPRPVHHANAAVVDGTIYVLGALGGSFAPLADAAWALRGGVWEVVEPPPVVRGSAAVGVVDGKIVLAGGLLGLSAIDAVHVYDPASDTWADATNLPEPRDHGCGASLDGRFFVVGGRGGGITQVTASVLELVDETWVERADMPTGRGGVACGVVGERLVVVGGEGNPEVASGVYPEVELYDAAADAWSSDGVMPSPRHGMGAAGWDGALYVPGGADRQAFGAVATFEIYRP